MKVFIISLKKAIARQAQIKNQLKSASVDFDFFTASDGNALNEAEKELVSKLSPDSSDRLGGKQKREAHKLQKLYPKLLAGEVGCYLSHYRLLTKIIDENIEIAVILEDDIHLKPDFSEICQNLSHIDYRWDIIRLCGLRSRKYQKIVPFYQHYNLVKLLNTACGTQAYAVTACGAKKLLKLLEVMILPVDITLDNYWTRPEIDFYAIQPYPVTPAPSASMIDNFTDERAHGKNRHLNLSRVKRLWLKHRKSIAKRIAIAQASPRLKTEKNS